MMKRFCLISLVRLACCMAGLAFIASGCGTSEKEGVVDTREEGTIHISADESFKPVVDAEIAVYESSYPKANIIVHYKPEAECLKDFLVDSIRMIIATRGFSENEESVIVDSLKVEPFKMTVAFDAIAVIVHPESADSMFTMNEIRSLLKGTLNKKLFPVFDGVNATSTVRYAIDSILRGDTLGSHVVAAQSSEGVVDYVAKTKNAVGFLGVSWVGNKQDSSQRTFLKKIRLAHIESTDRPGGYVLPLQANIYAGRYPMIRPLVYTLKDKNRGLATGFAHFLSNQRGQLIFRRAYLVPGQQRFNIRSAILRE